MARKAPRARFVKAGQACPAGWTKKKIHARGGRVQELCVANKR